MILIVPTTTAASCPRMAFAYRPRSVFGDAELLHILNPLTRVTGWKITLTFQIGLCPDAAPGAMTGGHALVAQSVQPNPTYAAPAAAMATALASPTRRPTASPPTQAAIVAFEAVLTATASKIA